LTENVKMTRSKARFQRHAGTALITVGLLLLGVLVYKFWWTNISADRTAAQIRTELQTQWQDSTEPTIAGDTPPSTIALSDVKPMDTPQEDEAFGLLYIPRLLDDAWGVPILQGVNFDLLSQGVGHYSESSLPDSAGNFALFGHRTANGEPFVHIERLKAGDDVIVETENYWFVYTLKLDRIVSPSAFGVVSNAPLTELHTVPGDPYQVITLITCEPRWSTEKRWVWWGTLSAVYPRKTPPLVIKVLDRNL
jgi:LPXTG-site transpeptidase (sortase) family protein